MRTRRLATLTKSGEVPFPWKMGAARWEVTQEIRDRFGIQNGTVTNFDIKFKDGTSLLAEKYRNLLDVIRNYLRELWFENTKASTYNRWNKLKLFIFFLVEERGVNCLSDAWGVDEYVAYVKSKRGKSPSSPAVGDEASDTGTRRKAQHKARKQQLVVTPDAMFSYIFPVKRLWHLSSRMQYGLKVEPWPGKSAANVSQCKGRADVANRTLPFTLPQFSAIIRFALSDLTDVDAACAYFITTASWCERIARIARIRTAATALVFAFAGLRPEEVYALPLDCLRSGDLKTEEGTFQVMWLDGRLFKNKPPGGTPHSWIAADEVITAVGAMRKVWSALRDGLERPFEEGGVPEKTAPAIVNSDGLLFPKLRVSKGNAEVVSRTGWVALQNFAKRPELATFFPQGTSFAQKRFRPTIARAFARLKLGDIRYFQEHFGHDEWKTTEGYFMTFADGELQDEVQMYLDSEAQGLFNELMTSDTPLAGGRGKELEPLRREFPVMIYEDQKALIRALQRGHDIRVGPQAMCVVKKGGQFCSHDCLYEETKCNGCDRGVIAQRHMPIWTDMQCRNEALLAELPADSPGAVTTRRHLEEIREVIQTLTVKKDDET